MEKSATRGGGGERATPSGKSFRFLGPFPKIGRFGYIWGGLEHALVHWYIVVFLFHQFLKQSTCSKCPKEACSVFIKGAGYYR